LRLPPGQYVLKIAPSNPVYGPTVSIEGAGPSAGSTSPTAVATLAVPGAAGGFKFTPGASGPKLPPSAMKISPGPSTAPASVHYGKLDPPGAPVAHHYKVTPPSGHKDAPSGKQDAPSWKWDGAPGLSTDRVLISSRAIGENCFVAIAGFADLMDAVQRAGAVALVVT
jgi:hypothetical protein